MGRKHQSAGEAIDDQPRDNVSVVPDTIRVKFACQQPNGQTWRNLEEFALERANEASRGTPKPPYEASFLPRLRHANASNPSL